MVAEAELRRIATELRRTLKDIASYYSPAAEQDGEPAAARRARATLEHLGLLYDDDARRLGLD